MRHDANGALRGHTEAQILAVINAGLAEGGGLHGPRVLVGPGDDTALLQVDSGSVLITTDAMVLERDWRDDWSPPVAVGRKCVAQNAADIAAMGGGTTGLVVTLAAGAETTLAWVADLAVGIGQEAARAGATVLGGDLSSAPVGVRMVSVTAVGELAGRGPVLRSGARPGDVLAVSGRLGRSAAGLLLLQQERAETAPELVAYHRIPVVDYGDGPSAAAAGATAMLDVSDGLLLDAGRIAAASEVRIDIDSDCLATDVADLEVVGDAARQCVLTGGEEHVLLATFPPGAVPAQWNPIGRISLGDGVRVDGQDTQGGGWDHFA